MLSSNTLFHFTKNSNTLSKILINGFRPSYCNEDFGFLKENRENCEFYIPMVCFCDIPLSQIEPHVERYGKFGLGMDINWGIYNGISPITYVSKTSEIYYSMQVLEKLFYTATSNTNAKKLDFSGQLAPASKLDILLWHIIPILCYLKPYKSVDSVSGLIQKYYDEKEWRFLPGFQAFPERNPFFLRIPTTKSLDNERGEFFLREQYCSHLSMEIEDAYELGKSLMQNSFLKFEIKDLKYIIVHNENDIFNLLEQLKTESKFTNEDIEKIICRTITYKQIKEDF